MSSLVGTVAAVVALFVALVAGLQIFVRLRVRGMLGKAAPVVTGALGERISRGARTLVYFHSPGCGACRPFTPRLVAAGRKNPAVNVVDVAARMDVARAFGVMATPSTVEVEDGRIVDYRAGPPAPELLVRYGA